jgi:sugar/nucleoside kinase (ribokinase family)
MTPDDAEFAYDVLCYGTISADNLIYVPFLPTPKRDSHVLDEVRVLGGEAVTVALVLRDWGLRVAIMGNAIGQDNWGEFIQSELEAHPGIDMSYVEQLPGVRTPICRILVTPDGERSILGYWFDDAPKTQLVEDVMRQARLLSVDVYGRGERDTAARVARRLGRPVVAADAIWPAYALASLSDIDIISRDFLYRHFPGVYIYDHALELQEAGAGDIIVTQGQDPVLVVDRKGRPSKVETFPSRAVDTTGAGDVFKAGVIYGYLQGWDVRTAARFACAASSLHVRTPRGQYRTPDLKQARKMAGV